MSASDVLKQFARLSANYGDSRISTPEQRTLLLREWLEAFGHHAPEHLHQAVTQAMKATKFWPTLAEVDTEVRAIRREVIEAVDTVTGRTRWQASKGQFAREGRTEAEEIAHRTAQTLRWKQEARASVPEFSDPLDAKPTPREASKSGAVSFALYHSCNARRARGEETCAPNCFSAKPGIRKCKIDQFHRIEAGYDELDVSTPQGASA